MDVSVVIPAYDESPEALAKTIDACLKQTYPVQEVIIVDDGFPNPTQLPKELELKERVHLLRLAKAS